MVGLRKLVGAILIASVVFTGGAAWAAEHKVSATAPWQGAGQVFQVSPDELLFLGKFEGVMYLEGAAGALDAALLLCPATMTINVEKEKTSGSGHCIITGPKGNMAYGKWQCEGVPGQCVGEMTLTGGSGPYQGLSGSGKMIIRTLLTTLAADLHNGEVVSGAAGLALWPELTYHLPGE